MLVDLNSEPKIQPGLVSVMMPAYNAAEFIRAAVESVLAQTYPKWELVIVNDGSTDETGAILAQFHDPRIRIFEQANAGEAAARNRALSEAQGEFMAFLDADDQFLPEYLSQALTYLLAHPQRDAVYTDGYYVDTTDQVIGRLSDQRRGPFEDSLLEALIRASDVFGPPICVLLRRQMLLDHPTPFDERIVIGPDWDFFTRLAQYASFGYLDQVTCRYRVHQTNVTVRTGSHKRRESLTFCRQKAIQLPGFAACSLETRAYVFYDLLINLLIGQPERQRSLLDDAAFQGLPVAEQARLCRLTALAMIEKNDSFIGYTHYLIQQAATLNPSDRKNRWLNHLYRITPAFLTALVRWRARLRQPAASHSPFSIPT